MDYTEKKLRRINSYEGLVVSVTMDTVGLPDGSESLREVIHHPGGICVLPVDSEGNAWCVQQYRYAAERHMLEAPAGKLEYGESHREAALRELSEETGLVPGELVDLGWSYTSPGISTEGLHLFLALNLKQEEAHPDNGELLNVIKIPLQELLNRIMENEIADAKTIMVALKAEKYLKNHKI